MKKIILPKYIAGAIEALLNGTFKSSKSAFFNHFTTGINTYLFYEERVAYEYFKDNFDQLMEVLVNGYEVELTKEEKVVEYMKEYKRNEAPDGTTWTENALNNVVKTAVVDVLNILDVKIEGVNI